MGGERDDALDLQREQLANIQKSLYEVLARADVAQEQQQELLKELIQSARQKDERAYQEDAERRARDLEKRIAQMHVEIRELSGRIANQKKADWKSRLLESPAVNWVLLLAFFSLMTGLGLWPRGLDGELMDLPEIPTLSPNQAGRVQ